jgi:Uma2 family endonuclease
MNVALRRTMSVAEFLAWEERQELRYEFDGVRPVAMTGGTLAHDQITFNIRNALASRLRGSPCRPFGPNVKVLAGDRVRYPDALVTCSRQDLKTSITDHPVVVFEVLNEGTARIDRGEKLRDYLAAPSITHYVLVEQVAMVASIHTRDGDRWIVTGALDGEMIDLPAIGVQIPVTDLYDGVETVPQVDDGPPIGS